MKSILFSFIGYNTLEEQVSGRTILNIALTPTTETLEEVIVIGYGVQKKSDLTGSVVRVSMAEKASLAKQFMGQGQPMEL